MATTENPGASGLEETRKQAEIKLEPELRPIAEHTLAVFELAAKKAIAHHAAPKQYPLPAGSGHPEQLMYARLKQRPADKSAHAAKLVMPSLSGGLVPAVGGRPAIDLRRPEPVAQQLDRLAPPASINPEALLAGTVDGAAAAPKAAAAVAPYTRVELRLRKVVCVEESNEWGSDELDLAGLSIDATGDTRKLTRFRVHSDFDSGEVDYNPPKTLASFPFAADNTIKIDGKTKSVGYPRSYFVTFMPAEIDNGGFPDFATQMYEKAKVLVTAYIAKAVGAYFGGALGAVIGAAVGKIVGWVMDKLFGLLVTWWEDDMFIPLTSTAKVLGLTADFKGKVGGTAVTSPRRLVWKQHGAEYEFHYEWVLVH
jgi:hypothetical protein